MKKKELKRIEDLLLRMRERALKELSNYDESFNSSLQASDGDLSAYSFHMADQGTDAMEREKAFLFASREGRFLYHLNQALERIEKGVLGDYSLGFGNGYFIHGTLYTRLLGRNVTHGCIRVGDEDLRKVFTTAGIGTKIIIF